MSVTRTLLVPKTKEVVEWLKVHASKYSFKEDIEIYGDQLFKAKFWEMGPKKDPLYFYLQMILDMGRDLPNMTLSDFDLNRESLIKD